MSNYASKYHLTFAARDGYTYRAEIRRRGWTGGSTSLTGGVAPYVLRGGQQGGRDVLPAVMLSEAEISVVDRHGDVVQEILGADPTAYQVVLIRETTSGDEILYQHYIDTSTYSEPAWDAVKTVAFRATDGLEVLNNRRVIASGDHITMLEVILQSLQAVGMMGGLVTSCRWWPWLPNPMPAGADPLAELATLRRMWDDGGAVHVRLMEALQAVLRRFQLRLFQSAGRWYAVQRAYLEGGSMERFEYDASGAQVASGAVSVMADQTHYHHKAKPMRGLRTRAKSVVQEYDFTPDLDDLLLNGSFEDAGTIESEAEHWTVEGGVTRTRLVDMPELEWNVDPTFNNEWALKIEPAAVPVGGSMEVGAHQRDYAFIPANPRYRVHTTFTSGTHGDPESLPAWLGVRVGDYYLLRDSITVAGDALSGRDVEIHVHPVLNPGTSGFTAGTAIIPRGTTLWAGAPSDRFTMELTRDVHVGDTMITANMSQDLSRGSTFWIAYWGTGGSGGGLEFYPLRGLATQTFDTYLTTPSGVPVSGDLRIEVLRGNAFGATEGYSVLDSARVSVSADGAAVGTIARQVSAVTGDGWEADLPTVPIGDGPAVYSDSRIVAMHGTPQDTLQGPLTGWKVGPYSAGEPTTHAFLDELAAREALYQQASILERVQTTILLRSGAMWAPHQVLTFTQRTRLSYAAAAGAEEIMTPARLREGRTATIGGHERTVLEVRGGGPYVAVLDAPLPQALPAGTHVFYSVPIWADHYAWDVRAGEVYIDGTELYRREVPYEADILIEGD